MKLNERFNRKRIIKNFKDYTEASKADQIAFFEKHQLNLHNYEAIKSNGSEEEMFVNAVYEQETDGEKTGLWAVAYDDNSENGTEFVFDFANEEDALHYVNLSTLQLFLEEDDMVDISSYLLHGPLEETSK